MIIYLSGASNNKKTAQILASHHAFVLESFIYANSITEKYMNDFGGFMADSGAFTYLNGRSGEKIDWDDYAERYANFINKNHIKYYLELDVDKVIGYSEVLRLRDKLYSLTNVPPIPVWHRDRGKSDFIETCKNYPYVALGGIAIKEIDLCEYKYFPWFINTAHEHGAKIHGLGFTKMKGLEKYHFDSVDSTTWQTGGTRFGYLHVFNGRKICKIRRPEGKALAPNTELFNLEQWIKFQKYALTHL